jgi:signal transduction histidine kinase
MDSVHAQDAPLVTMRWPLTFAGLYVVCSGLNLVVVGVVDPVEPAVVVTLVVGLLLGLATGALAVFRPHAALLVQFAGTLALIAFMHITSPAADTAPYYATPILLLTLSMLASRWRVPVLVVGMSLLVVIRSLSTVPDPYWTSHTADLLIVVGTSSAVLMVVRSQWSITLAQLQATVADLERARSEAVHLQAVAEAANASKSRFLANMSHELRTPLNAVLGYAEMIAEEADDEGIRSDASRIEGAGRHLLGIVDDVLDLARVENGGRTPSPTSFCIRQLMEQLATWMRPQLEARGNRIVLEVPEVTVSADPLMVRQIVLNLLSNANRFSEGSPVGVSARVSGADLCLVVADRGIGMSADQLARVREPFVQATERTALEYGGTGLGLTLVDRFTQLMGGSVEIRSTPGGGTSVCVELPGVVDPS